MSPLLLKCLLQLPVFVRLPYIQGIICRCLLVYLPFTVVQHLAFPFLALFQNDLPGAGVATPALPGTACAQEIFPTLPFQCTCPEDSDVCLLQTVSHSICLCVLFSSSLIPAPCLSDLIHSYLVKWLTYSPIFLPFVDFFAWYFQL